TDALQGRVNSEGILEDYMAHPDFAVYDILADAGLNPDRNIFTRQVQGKWGDTLGDFATMAQMLSPTFTAGGETGEGSKDWANFVNSWAGGGGDALGVMRGALQLAQTNTPQGEAMQELLG